MIWKLLKDRIQGKAPKGARRSKKWPRVRRTHLNDNPRCAICRGNKRLEVHHKVPFHLAPDLELEPSNLITLCERKKYGINCHLLMGHLGNYRKFNPAIDVDALVWNRKLL